MAKCGLPREEFFITTKVWISNAECEKAKASIEESLKKLQVSYIDLLLIHHFAEIKPAVSQVETPVFQQQKLAKEYMKKNGTQIESWGPFAEGKMITLIILL